MGLEGVVAVQHAHSKLLNEAARQVLGPLGLTQKGRSRTWLDDHGWWLGVVEFQPSSFGRGSYLNVGVNWLWTPKDYLSYDFGGRLDVGGYAEYETDDQFRPLAMKLAALASEEVARLRELFPTVDAAAKRLAREKEPSVVEAIDAGIALGLTGDGDRAGRMLARYMTWFESDEEREWRIEDDRVLYDRARTLTAIVDDAERFREQVARDVQSARSLLGLARVDPLAFE